MVTEKTTVSTQALRDRLGQDLSTNNATLRQQVQAHLNANHVQVLVRSVSISGAGAGIPGGTPGIVTIEFDPGPGVTAREVKAALI